MNENEHLTSIIDDPRRKSNEAEVESLREDYHQRVATLERKICLEMLYFANYSGDIDINWVQMIGMKPGPDSIGIVAVSHICSGVAARACGLVSLEPTKVAEILKDRPYWFCDCCCLDVLSAIPAGNGGLIELIYMQTYAPTTLAVARGYWTVRYTTSLEDGSLVVNHSLLGLCLLLIKRGFLSLSTGALSRLILSDHSLRMAVNGLRLLKLKPSSPVAGKQEKIAAKLDMMIRYQPYFARC